MNIILSSIFMDFTDFSLPFNHTQVIKWVTAYLYNKYMMCYMNIRFYYDNTNHTINGPEIIQLATRTSRKIILNDNILGFNKENNHCSILASNEMCFSVLCAKFLHMN